MSLLLPVYTDVSKYTLSHVLYFLFFLIRYREDRKWWEIVIAFRKVGIVAVSTFGTMMGAVDLQAFIALAVVFLSIVLHLFGIPFDMNKRNTRLLHHLEFGALTVCWFTFWGRSILFNQILIIQY